MASKYFWFPPTYRITSVRSSNASYATMRAGSSLTELDAVTLDYALSGQALDSGTYYGAQAAFQWDARYLIHPNMWNNFTDIVLLAIGRDNDISNQINTEFFDYDMGATPTSGWRTTAQLGALTELFQASTQGAGPIFDGLPQTTDENIKAALSGNFFSLLATSDELRTATAPTTTSEYFYNDTLHEVFGSSSQHVNNLQMLIPTDEFDWEHASDGYIVRAYNASWANLRSSGGTVLYSTSEAVTIGSWFSPGLSLYYNSQMVFKLDATKLNDKNIKRGTLNLIVYQPALTTGDLKDYNGVTRIWRLYPQASYSFKANGFMTQADAAALDVLGTCTCDFVSDSSRDGFVGYLSFELTSEGIKYIRENLSNANLGFRIIDGRYIGNAKPTAQTCSTADYLLAGQPYQCGQSDTPVLQVEFEDPTNMIGTFA